MNRNVARIPAQPARRSDDARLQLPDGASAQRVDDALELRDRSGALLIRYENGHAEVYAASGDLTLAAPQGRVVVRAGSQLTLDAGERIAVNAPAGEVKLGHASVAADRITTRARSITQYAERYQLVAGQLMEQARDTFRDVSGLLQSRIGRMRTLVEGEHTLHTKRNVQVSQGDTCIDGKRILLG